MAYGVKYKAGWSSRKGLQGYLYIDLEGYSGAVTDLILKHSGGDDLRIEQNWTDWESPILGKTLSFTLVNHFTDFFEILPLLTATEREYRVRVEVIAPSSKIQTLFQGYLNLGSTSQRYLNKQSITLVASTYLSKLDNYTASMVETLQDVYFINLIDSILSSIGSYNIRVNCSLHDGGGLTSGQTLFNKNGINTEVFWEDNVKRKNNLEILRMILTSFNCYIYWKDGYWYIERFTDIWDESVTYVEYTTGVTYTEASTGAVVPITRTVTDVHDLVFLRQSQTLYIEPGYKTIQINLDSESHLLLNLANSLVLANIANDSTAGVLPDPDIRVWEKDSDITWTQPSSFGSIVNVLKVSPILDLTNNPVIAAFVTSEHFHRGLYTKFRILVAEDTKLGIEFKYGCDANFSFAASYNVWNFTLHWYLREAGTSNFLIWNDSLEAYEWVAATTSTGYNSFEVLSSAFNTEEKTTTFKATLPVGEIAGSSLGEKTFILGVGQPGIDRVTAGEEDEITASYFGDFLLTVTDTLENNEIIGNINTLFLNKKEIDIDIADVANINYVNGILGGASLGTRTSLWTGQESTPFSLMYLLLIDKFRMHNVSRQRISADVFDVLTLELFDLFQDSKQSNKKFVLTGYSYSPLEDEYELDLYEFDTDTVIVIA